MNNCKLKAIFKPRSRSIILYYMGTDPNSNRKFLLEAQKINGFKLSTYTTFVGRVARLHIAGPIPFMSFLEFMSLEFVKFKYAILIEFTKSLRFVKKFQKSEYFGLYDFLMVKKVILH